MSDVISHAKIIDMWPSIQDLASDVDANLAAVRKWHYRNNIPAEYWTRLVAAGHRRDLPITYKGLAEWCAVREQRLLLVS